MMNQLTEALRMLIRGILHPGPTPGRWAIGSLVLIGVAVLLDIALIERGLTIHDNAGRYFGEGRPGTVAVVALLVTSAVICVLIGRDLAGDALARFWFVFAGVFAFLAADDMFKIHERIDPLIARVFGLDPEAAFVDEIDSVLVALYLPLVAFLTWKHRVRLAEVGWFVLSMSIGAVLFVGMVVVDIANGSVALEESLKLFAAVAIVLALAAARLTWREQRATVKANASHDGRSEPSATHSLPSASGS
ncbi:MAG: hypothetical protein AAGB51_02285 [Planctomycetota bacterium]